MDTKITKSYLKSHNTEVFSVTKEGIFKPLKGYEIIFLKEKKSFVFKSVDQPMPQSISGFDIEKIPGGTMFCLCDAANDDCSIDATLGPDKVLRYFCGGQCGCTRLIIFDDCDPLQVQTGGSGWNDYNNGSW